MQRTSGSCFVSYTRAIWGPGSDMATSAPLGACRYLGSGGSGCDEQAHFEPPINPLGSSMAAIGEFHWDILKGGVTSPSEVAQWERAGLITLRSSDRN